MVHKYHVPMGSTGQPVISLAVILAATRLVREIPDCQDFDVHRRTKNRLAPSGSWRSWNNRVRKRRRRTELAKFKKKYGGQ